MNDLSVERMAENEATFREANEGIETRARELEFSHPIPFLCECGDPECHDIVTVPIEDYEAVRRVATHFLVVPGHERVAVPAGRVVARFDGHVVVEKLGEAAEIAERRDERGSIAP
jgi:hypothetical protein